MFRHQIRLSLLAVLAAGLLALSGCGGGSSTTAPADSMDSMPMEHTVDLSGLEAEATAGEAEIAAGMSAVIGDVEYSCPAGGEDCSVAVVASEDGIVATSTGGMATAADSPAYETRETMAMTAEANTKRVRIVEEAAQGPGQTPANPDAGLGGSGRNNADGTADTADDPYGLSIERDDDGTTVKITDPANAGDDDPKFTQADDLGNGRTMHTRTMKADDDGNVETEVVIVQTDIMAPKDVAFADWESNAGGDKPQALTVMGNDGAIPGENEDADALDIDEDTDLADDANTYIVLDRSTTDGVLTYSRDNPGTQPTMNVDEGEHDGTYNGAEGKYRCTSTTTDNCTVTFNDKGQVTGNSDNWVFVPDKGATSSQPDYEYLSYGVWLKKTKTKDEDGVTKYDEVETFYSVVGHPETTNGDLAGVEGTATYNGYATGVYVKDKTDDSATRLSSTAGHFSASVKLDASFGGGDVADNRQFTIDGEITGFELSGGETNDWEVSLDLTDFSGRGTGEEPGKSDHGTAYDNEFSGVTTGDATADRGTWNGAFYGSSTAVDGVSPQPVAVVGEFNADFTDGTVAGAFGTNKAPEAK